MPLPQQLCIFFFSFPCHTLVQKSSVEYIIQHWKFRSILQIQNFCKMFSKRKIEVAIKIIDGQIQKAKKPDFHYDSWKIQTGSIIKGYFGSESTEYKQISRFPINGIEAWNYNKSQIDNIERSDAVDVCKHLEAAKDTLRIKGLYKKPSWFSGLPLGWQIFIATAALGIAGWIFREVYNSIINRSAVNTAPIITPDIKPHSDTSDTAKKNTAKYDSTNVDKTGVKK